MNVEEQLYDRQKELPLRKIACLHVVGCGGIGWWVAKLAALSGIPEIHLWDGDEIHPENLNRLDLSPDKIGEKKAEVLLKEIKEIRPNTKIISHDYFLTREHFQSLNGVVIEATDDFSIQNQLETYCKTNDIPIIHIHYNGYNSITLETELAASQEWGEVPDRYAITPSFVVPAVLAAGLAIWLLLSTTDLNVNGRPIILKF